MQTSQCDRKRKCGHDTLIAMTIPDKHETIRSELRQAVFDCRERGLYEAASWAAQHLTSLPASTTSHTEGVGIPGGENESDAYLVAKSLFDCKVRSSVCCFDSCSLVPLTVTRQKVSLQSAAEHILLSLFEILRCCCESMICNDAPWPKAASVQEYQRCSHALIDSCEGKGHDKERFLKFYSLYLAGERRRQYASYRSTDSARSQRQCSP